MKTLDLNCDMGEGLGAWKMGDDAALLDHVTSANIACGFHAGDPGTIHRTVQLALDKGVAIGAHPSLPDLQGFGRRRMNVSAEEAYDMVLYQIGALAGFATACGGKLAHVKPHGALYNMAARDPELAEAGLNDLRAPLRAIDGFVAALIRIFPVGQSEYDTVRDHRRVRKVEVPGERAPETDTRRPFAPAATGG